MGRKLESLDILNAKTVYINPRVNAPGQTFVAGSGISLTATVNVVGLTGPGVIELCDIICSNTAPSLRTRVEIDGMDAYSHSGAPTYHMIVGAMGLGTAFCAETPVPFHESFNVYVQSSSVFGSNQTVAVRLAYRLVQP